MQYFIQFNHNWILEEDDIYIDLIEDDIYLDLAEDDIYMDLAEDVIYMDLTMNLSTVACWAAADSGNLSFGKSKR